MILEFVRRTRHLTTNEYPDLQFSLRKNEISASLITTHQWRSKAGWQSEFQRRFRLLNDVPSEVLFGRAASHPPLRYWCPRSIRKNSLDYGRDLFNSCDPSMKCDSYLRSSEIECLRNETYMVTNINNCSTNKFNTIRERKSRSQ